MDSVESMVARIDERTQGMDERDRIQEKKRDERDARIEAKLDAHCVQLSEHEKRIGGLEGFKMSVYIASAAVVTLTSLGIAVFGLV